MAHDDIQGGLQQAALALPLAPCGEVLAGEHCGCGRTWQETQAEVAAYEAWLANHRASLTSPEAAR